MLCRGRRPAPARLGAAGVSAAGIDDICFIGGYRIEAVRAAYPQFTFRENTDWENNNILVSLMYAEDLMDEPFVCTYSDMLFTADVVKRLHGQSRRHRALGRYRLARALRAPQRASADRRREGDRRERPGHAKSIATSIPPSRTANTPGSRSSPRAGAAALKEHYHRRRRAYAGKPFREAAVFEKAYLIHLFQDMIEDGVRMAHADTPGNYIEVDTQQDFEFARNTWCG